MEDESAWISEEVPSVSVCHSGNKYACYHETLYQEQGTRQVFRGYP